MNLAILYCLLAYGLHQSVGDQELEGITDEVFKPKNESTDTTNENFGFSANCECVPYFRCTNFEMDIHIRPTSKCDDYLSVCCEPEHLVEYTEKPEPKCGRRNPDGVGFRITDDGDHAHFGEFPWMVALLGKESMEGKLNESWSYKCGASLIHPQVVLTAAHCISDNYKNYKIRAGEWDSLTENELYLHQERNVKTIIVHPDYNKKLLFHDYALLILDSPVKIEENVQVVCLPSKDDTIDNSVCYSNGWGKANFGNKNKHEAFLKKVHIPIVDTDKCQTSLRTTRLGTHFNLHESFLCAGGQQEKDTCSEEDGGSPLVCPISGKEETYFQVGVVSWGLHCEEVPRVYANVIKAVEWIDKTMINNGFETTTYKY